MVDYGPLWDSLKEKGMSQYTLINSGIDKHTLQNLRTNRGITMATLEKLCNIIGAGPEKVVQFIAEDESTPSSKNKKSKK